MLGLVVLLGAGAAQAAEPASGEDGQNASDPCLNDTLCRGHYDEARQAYKDKRYEEALKEYRAAYERRQAPWLLINVGRTLQRLGRLDESLDYYQRYLRADPNPKPEVKSRVEEYIGQVKAGIETAPKKEPEPAPTLTAAPVAPVQPVAPPQPESKPVYKKWSYKKNRNSDGAGCWNGASPLRSPRGWCVSSREDESVALSHFCFHIRRHRFNATLATSEFRATPEEPVCAFLWHHLGSTLLTFRSMALYFALQGSITLFLVGELLNTLDIRPGYKLSFC
ncbi:MAG: tetratricopeptide repeat protein [Polyangia bacterium]